MQKSLTTSMSTNALFIENLLSSKLHDLYQWNLIQFEKQRWNFWLNFLHFYSVNLWAIKIAKSLFWVYVKC